MRISELSALSLADLEFNIVDVETTGMYPKFNRIMDLAVVKVKNGQITSKKQFLINPDQAVPGWISSFTGIFDNHVKEAPLFETFAPEIYELLHDGVFVGHNVGFDYGFV